MVYKTVKLPISEPLYSTYHYQGISSAVFSENSYIKNWHLNNIMQLYCNRKFLRGFTTPELTVNESNFEANPLLDQIHIPFKYLNGCANKVIKAFINDGYYVVFRGIDDYYISGKSFYKEKHFFHDGLICGYDDIAKNYSIYAYDINWIYRVFETPQSNFDEGRKSMMRQGIGGYLCALKPNKTEVELDINEITKNIGVYLDSSLEKYPLDGEGNVFGTATHDYIKLYLDKLLDGSIPYDRMDWRVFRMLWEHKKLMYERIVAVEKLSAISSISRRYLSAVKEADNMRMLYASYHRRRRDSLLQSIKKKLDYVSSSERALLEELIY